jgi:uncharacterized protein (UPF0332 family)
VALPEDLLEQAKHLARRDPKRPKQASLRRAISTAYYALFHLLVSETVRNWKHAGSRDELARMFEHTNMRTACVNKRNELKTQLKTVTKTAPLPNVTVLQRLHLVAETFVDMHAEREKADYDYSATWTRTEAVSMVTTVESAFKAWQAIRNEDAAQAFLFTLLQKKRR